MPNMTGTPDGLQKVQYVILKKDHTEIWIMQTYSESQEKNMWMEMSIKGLF